MDNVVEEIIVFKRKYDVIYSMNKHLVSTIAALKIRNSNLELEIDILKNRLNRLIKYNDLIEKEIKDIELCKIIKVGGRKKIDNLTEKCILETIIKLNTTNVSTLSCEFKVSNDTIKNRLLEYDLYPIDLRKAILMYKLFYDNSGNIERAINRITKDRFKVDTRDKRFMYMQRKEYDNLMDFNNEMWNLYNELMEKNSKYVSHKINLISELRGIKINIESLEFMKIRAIEKMKSCGEIKFNKGLHDINKESIFGAIIKLRTTKIQKIADYLDVSYNTIKNRLIKYNNYPIDLEKIQQEYKDLTVENTK